MILRYCGRRAALKTRGDEGFPGKPGIFFALARDLLSF
jgi:hypothetical protein